MVAYLIAFQADMNAEARQRAMIRCEREMPLFGMEVNHFSRDFEELQGGWIGIMPREHSVPSLLLEQVEQDIAILFYGELFTPNRLDPCAYLVDLWRRHPSPERIGDLNGNFVAFIVDRREGRLHVVGDRLGRRLPRILSTPHGLVAASQDLLLAATGRCTSGLDPSTAAALLAMDWPQGGRSLLRDVAAMPPQVRLTLERGEVHRHLLPLNRDRLPPHPEAVNDRIHAMLTSLQDHMDRLFQDSDHVSVDLSGGVDSRVVCALTRSRLAPTAFHVECAGGANSAEVRIAREICRREGLDFHRLDPIQDFPAPAAFEETLSALAFFLDGAGNARFAVRRFPPDNWQNHTHLHGTGGELFRGRYYLKSGAGGVSGFGPEALTHHLDGILVRAQAKFLLQPEARDSIRTRLQEAMTHWCDVATSPTDALDLFFLYDRTLYWAVADARLPWLRRRVSPFLYPELVRLGWGLPAPLGEHGLGFYREAVRRYLPGGWLVPTVAGSDILNPALPHAKISNSGLIKAWRYYRHRIGGVLMRRLPQALAGRMRGTDDARGDYFAHEASELVRSHLTANTGVLAEITPAGMMQTLVEQHLSGAWYHTEVIGSALVLAQWETMARRVMQRARSETE